MLSVLSLSMTLLSKICINIIIQNPYVHYLKEGAICTVSDQNLDIVHVVWIVTSTYHT